MSKEIVLDSGQKRSDFIREQYYEQSKKRGEIAKELGVVYQIVFAATKLSPEQYIEWKAGGITLSGDPRKPKPVKKEKEGKKDKAVA